MPEISQFFNIHITFNYRNEHNPPHFHARYQDEEITVDIENGLIKGKMNPRAKALVVEWYERHKDELFENWDLAQKRLPLKKITPLDKE